jgi:hypothetical protein
LEIDAPWIVRLKQCTVSYLLYYGGSIIPSRVSGKFVNLMPKWDKREVPIKETRVTIQSVANTAAVGLAGRFKSPQRAGFELGRRFALK